MIIVFDNIIFTIQKWGGISVYWDQILKRSSSEKCYLLALKNQKKSFKELNNDNFSLINNKRINYLTKLERYINPNPNLNNKHIFHSSYYRNFFKQKFFKYYYSS